MYSSNPSLMGSLFLVSTPLTVSIPFSQPLQNSIPACSWVPCLTRSLDLLVGLASSGAKFGSNSTWTFKPNPHRQVTDSCPCAPILNSSERDMTVQLRSVVNSTLSAMIQLREVFLGEWEGRFSKESEKCEWVGMNIMSTLFKEEVDSVFLVYLRYTNNWTNGLLFFTVIHKALRKKPLFSWLSFYIFNDFQMSEQNTFWLSKNIVTNLQNSS